MVTKLFGASITKLVLWESTENTLLGFEFQTQTKGLMKEDKVKQKGPSFRVVLGSVFGPCKKFNWCSFKTAEPKISGNDIISLDPLFVTSDSVLILIYKVYYCLWYANKESSFLFLSKKNSSFLKGVSLFCLLISFSNPLRWIFELDLF